MRNRWAEDAAFRRFCQTLCQLRLACRAGAHACRTTLWADFNDAGRPVIRVECPPGFELRTLDGHYSANVAAVRFTAAGDIDEIHPFCATCWPAQRAFYRERWQQQDEFARAIAAKNRDAGPWIATSTAADFPEG